MDIIDTFLLSGSEHTVRMLKVNDHILFRADDVGAVLKMKNIRSSLASFERNEIDVHTVDTLGGPQTVTFLTKKGVYRLLFQSRRPEAKPFREWLLNVVETIERTGRYDVAREADAIRAAALAEGKAAAENELLAIRSKYEEKAAELAEMQQDFDEELLQQKHEQLLRCYADKEVVYVMRLVSDDDSMIVKIGSTKQIRVRASYTKQKYGQCTLLSCHETPNAFNFERMLQHHPDIFKYRHHGDIVDHKRSTEAFKIAKGYERTIANIIRANAHRFRAGDATPLDAIARQVRQITRHLGLVPEADAGDGDGPSTVRDAPGDNASVVEKAAGEEAAATDGARIDAVGEKRDPEGRVTDAPPAKRSAHSLSRGRKVQKYSADGKTLLRTYARMRLCLNDPDNTKEGALYKSNVESASKRKVLYRGHRWHIAPPDVRDDEAFDIGDTKDSVGRSDKNDVIVFAMEDDGETIARAYASRGDIAREVDVNPSYVIRNINAKRPIRGVLYRSRDMVSDDAIDDFTSRGNELPAHRRSSPGIRVQQIHPVTRDVIGEFDTVDSVMRRFGVGKKSLMQAIHGDTVMKESRWRIAA